MPENFWKDSAPSNKDKTEQNKINTQGSSWKDSCSNGLELETSV